jgi:hypothetical protein
MQTRQNLRLHREKAAVLPEKWIIPSAITSILDSIEVAKNRYKEDDLYENYNYFVDELGERMSKSNYADMFKKSLKTAETYLSGNYEFVSKCFLKRKKANTRRMKKRQ